MNKPLQDLTCATPIRSMFSGTTCLRKDHWITLEKNQTVLLEVFSRHRPNRQPRHQRRSVHDYMPQKLKKVTFPTLRPFYFAHKSERGASFHLYLSNTLGHIFEKPFLVLLSQRRTTSICRNPFIDHSRQLAPSFPQTDGRLDLLDRISKLNQT